MTLLTSPIANEEDITLTISAQIQRHVCLSMPSSKTPNCDKQIHICIGFDGTNNNAERDQKQITNPNKRSHSNVVVLMDTCKDDPGAGYFKYYVPGVGTPFKEIGEPTESDAGKAFGWGGESRIYWGMIQVLNSMHRAVANDKFLIPNTIAGKDVKSEPLYRKALVEANYPGMDAYFQTKLEELQKKLANITRPVLTQVNLSVFGFSRGAAQARAFCTFLDKLCASDGTLAGVKLHFQFLGIFDTVASVGMADAAPVFNGFGGYANGTLDVPARVARCVHYVAAHEMRKAFPLSSVRSAKKGGYLANCQEVVYPGSHSDVGGGYGPGAQGKSTTGRAALLSQVPLRHMYAEARACGVQLLDIPELKAKGLGDTVADLEIHPSLVLAFNAYRGWLNPVSTHVETMLHVHMDAYRQWRRLACSGPTKYAGLSSYRNASAQDREDMASSEREFQLEAYANLLKDDKQRSKAEHNLWLQEKVDPPPAAVMDFFDQFVHDSHASFYMVGPVTQQDRKDAIERARRAQAQARGNVSNMNAFERALSAPGVSESNFPLMTDFNTQAIANSKGVQDATVAFASSDTRRESGPFIRYRRVFDNSRGVVRKLLGQDTHSEQDAYFDQSQQA